MGIIKMKKAQFEFNEEEDREESIFIRYRNITLKLPMKEFIERLFQDQWHTLQESKPHENDHYWVFNNDPKYKGTPHWEAWWNGRYFQDREGGCYTVTHWREKPNQKCLPPISKSIRIEPQQFNENHVQKYAINNINIDQDIMEFAVK